MNHNRRGTIPRLEQLPPEQTTALIRWLTEDRLTYSQARVRLKADFGVVASAAALSSFWHQVCVPRQMIERAREERDAQVGGRVLLAFQIRLTATGDISLTVTTPNSDEQRPITVTSTKP